MKDYGYIDKNVNVYIIILSFFVRFSPRYPEGNKLGLEALKEMEMVESKRIVAIDQTLCWVIATIDAQLCAANIGWQPTRLGFDYSLYRTSNESSMVAKILPVGWQSPGHIEVSVVRMNVNRGAIWTAREGVLCAPHVEEFRDPLHFLFYGGPPPFIIPKDGNPRAMEIVHQSSLRYRINPTDEQYEELLKTA